MALNIRRITTHDKKALLKMAKAMHAESPRYQEHSFNEAKVDLLLDMYLVNPAAAGFILEHDGLPAGMLGILIGDMFFGDEKYVIDMITYIKPEFRGHDGFELIVATAEGWAASKGAVEYAPSVSFGLHMDKIVGAYKKLGYEIQSYGLRKKLNG